MTVDPNVQDTPVDGPALAGKPHPIYQLMPPLTAEEREALKEDIRANGILVAIEKDDQGNILDGHHRLELYKELVSEGAMLPPPDIIIRRGMTEEQKRHHVLALNLVRRHLSNEVRMSIFLELRKEGMTTRDIAREAGVSQPTVVRTLKDIINLGTDATESLPRFIEGKDGLMRPAAYAKRTVVTGERAIREQRAEERRAVQASIPDWLPKTGNRFVVMEGDFTVLQTKLSPAIAAAVITDPPYGKEFIPLYGKLVEFAGHILEEGGLLLAMAGQLYLPEVFAAMEEAARKPGVDMHYAWTHCDLLGGAASKVFPRGALCGWKPIIMYAKTALDTERFQYYDVIKSPGPDKDYHDWGQHTQVYEDQVRLFTTPGDVVVDPFCGGATTGVASMRLNRIFIGIEINSQTVNVARKRLNDEAERITNDGRSEESQAMGGADVDEPSDDELEASGL